MKTMKGFCMLFMLYLCLLDSGRTGKVLVWPVDFSHWINLKVILEELHHRGHEITVLVPSQNLLIDHTKVPYNVEILQLSITKETFVEELNTLLYEATFELSKLSWWEMQIKLANIGRKFLLTIKRVCDSAVTNKELLSRLQAAKFDVCIADPLSFCGELVAELLNIPFIYTFRFFYGNVIERLCAGLPMPSSYVPGVTSRLTDKMTFIQRLENWLLYTVSDMIYSYYVFPEWDEYYSKVLGKPTTICEIMGKADMWLFRSNWDFEFPQPYLPNTEFVGGLHCKPAKPLPKEFEEFVQSSGKDGVVVFTLGSMIKNLSEEKSNIIASALAQIPQKIPWRRERPPTPVFWPREFHRLYPWGLKDFHVTLSIYLTLWSPLPMSISLFFMSALVSSTSLDLTQMSSFLSLSNIPFHFHSIDSSYPGVWTISPSVYIIFAFFHQCLIIFCVQFSCLLR
ncbi:hypothetical protein FD755_023930 [Muntiacus reevesi]|uniref:UDP-glycosyltransferases domain-containing protein n=1 Tax=Muntiacus reevesi TaxID=9886 RepID=A0A5N3VVZ8_MUNRE|nr:hypothetical protein FD755_023930 [Muntiacus reevesi]